MLWQQEWSPPYFIIEWPCRYPKSIDISFYLITKCCGCGILSVQWDLSEFYWLSFLKRRKWLEEAISSIVEDTDVKRMMTYLQILEKPQNHRNDEDDGLSQKEDAFEDLSVIVDNLDNANGMFIVTVRNLWYQLELQSLRVVERCRNELKPLSPHQVHHSNQYVTAYPIANKDLLTVSKNYQIWWLLDQTIVTSNEVRKHDFLTLTIFLCSLSKQIHDWFFSLIYRFSQDWRLSCHDKMSFKWTQVHGCRQKIKI